MNKLTMGKLKSLARTIDDDIVKDGLCAVGTMEGVDATKGQYMVVGGIAVQSYLPSMCRRNTSDIDLCIRRPLNYEDFKTFSQSVRTWLEDYGYDISTRKYNSHFSLQAEKEDDDIVIEFSRRNQKSYDRASQRLEREFGNSRKKRVEERGAIYTVVSPEDIAVPKLVRSVNAVNRNPDLEGMLADFEGDLSDMKVQLLLREINDLREDAVYNPGDPEKAERLRLVSDTYDIRILSELTGFQIPYLEKAINDWNSLDKNDPIVKKLLSIMLPILAFNK